MRYNEQIQLKLYTYSNNSFIRQAIIDDYQEISFDHNLYEAGDFTITINYNIPNALKFERGMWVQFGNDPYMFGEIQTITDSIGEDGKGSQTRTIIGKDSRYIFKRRIIKNLNNVENWQMTDKGEKVLRELVKAQCGTGAESKRRLPVANTIPSSASSIGKEYSVSEAYSNLYDTLVTIATQSEIGWRIKFDGTLTLEVFEGTDLSSQVQFSTDYDSLSNGEFTDSAESYANTVYVGGKGNGADRDIYEGEVETEGATPQGLDRFEAWDNQSQMTSESEYEAEAFSMLTQYGQTLNISGQGLAKCPYVFKEQYNIGDTITLAFSGKSAKAQILSVTENWTWGQYGISFSFGKPQNDLSRQLQLILRQIQKASDKATITSGVRYYTIPTETAMPKSDVVYDTIGFVGTCASGGSTFTLYFDNEKTGAKTYHVYFKQLGGGKLTLTTGVSGKANLVLNSGTYVAIIYVDQEGNVTSQGATPTTTIEAGNTQPATSEGVYNALQPFSKRAIASANTTTTYPYYYIRLYDIPTNNTSVTPVITLLVGTRYNRYLMMINPWFSSGERLQIVSLTGNDAISIRIVDCAWFMSSTSEVGTMECWIKLRCNTMATGFSVLDLSKVVDTLKIDYIGNDNASYSGTTASAYFNNIANKGTLRLLDTTPTADSVNLITSGGVYDLINATTPSFDCPRGGTYTLNYLLKQQIGNVALYMGRVTIGSNASGGSMYLQVDGVRGSTHNICNSQWCIHGTSYEGKIYSAYGSGNASLWLRIGSTSTNLQTSECAGQSIDFSFMAIPYSA